MAKVSIKAKQGVYLSYRNYPYTVPQVFGEYIDNAIQSSEDHKHQLKLMSEEYRLRVDISVEWFQDFSDKTIKAKSVTIQDNAAGMSSAIFSHAFNLTDDDVTRKGMNEFGVGMKSASAWLGNTWKIETTSIDDRITRYLEVDLNKVSSQQIEELDSIDVYDTSKSHGTKIVISNLWPENVFTNDVVNSLKDTIASIYRYFIRNNEIEIYFEGELLQFKSYPILHAPAYNDPDGKEIDWIKNVEYDDGKGKTITGFIALLADMSDTKRGVVFTRNHRVVLGFDPIDRSVGKKFMGQVGSRKYRRVFGELEISGFSVSFGKNKLNDLESLEAFCSVLAGKLKIGNVNLLTQADNYSTRRKSSKKHETKPEENVPKEDPQKHLTDPINHEEEPQNTNTKASNSPDRDFNDNDTPRQPETATKHVEDLNLESGSFELDGEHYELSVFDSSDMDELFCNDASQLSDNKLICRINTSHPFFKKYGEMNSTVMTMIKILSISKYRSIHYGLGSASEMMDIFNEIISNISR